MTDRDPLERLIGIVGMRKLSDVAYLHSAMHPAGMKSPARREPARLSRVAALWADVHCGTAGHEAIILARY
jgi:hypothetical protein